MTTNKPGVAKQEDGFMLVGLIVAIFLILLVLGVAAPKVAKQLRRDREVEAVHRGNQYVRAVQLYYRKLGHYPGSLDQLEKTNNVRFLRQRYPDPMTGKPDWKLIHVGEAKTSVKGFFGKPLSGLPGAGGLGVGTAGSTGSVGAGTGSVGGAAGSSAGSGFGSSSFGSSGGQGSSFGSSSGPGSSFGSPGGQGSSGSSFGSSSFGSSGSSSGGSGSGSGTGSGSGSGTGTGGSSGIGSQSATSFSGTGAPIMGVGSAATGESIVVLNEQTTYPTWEFIYDPRIEQLKSKSGLLGGPPASAGGSGFGSSGSGSGFGSTSPGGSGAGSGFGSGSGGMGAASSGSTGTPTSGVPVPQ